MNNARPKTKMAKSRPVDFINFPSLFASFYAKKEPTKNTALFRYVDMYMILILFNFSKMICY